MLRHHPLRAHRMGGTMQGRCAARSPLRRPSRPLPRCQRRAASSSSSAGTTSSSSSIADLKRQLLLIAATTDRGQISREYNDRADEAKRIIEALRAQQQENLDTTAHDGTWEVVYATAQLFRASPFFMAIQYAFDSANATWHAPWSSEDTAVPSGDLFFRLHDLQVMSWGTSTIGRVTQTIDTSTSTVSSSFDTIIFRLTVIPIVGWFKLLPTFGGRVSSFAKGLELRESPEGGATVLRFELDRTRVDPTDGIPTPPFFLAWLMKRDFPVNAVWRLLPWNKGQPPMCETRVVYLDEDTRITQDKGGDVFVYQRVPG